MKRHLAVCQSFWRRRWSRARIRRAHAQIQVVDSKQTVITLGVGRKDLNKDLAKNYYVLFHADFDCFTTTLWKLPKPRERFGGRAYHPYEVDAI